MRNDIAIIKSIAMRAKTDLGVKDLMSLMMDLEHTHIINPLRLDELLGADFGNFAHDIVGITRNFNRRTLSLDNCFSPRYSK